MNRILVVDDEETVFSIFKEAFEMDHMLADHAADKTQVREKLARFKPQLIVLDIHFGCGKEKDGLEILGMIRACPDTARVPVIMITGQGDHETIVKCMDLGADHFIKKPVDMSELMLKVRTLLRQDDASRSENTAGGWHEHLVGSSKPMVELTLEIYRSAKAGLDTLILGENGTGKDLVARTYHRLSGRADRPFCEIDCTTIPRDLFESEIFGFKKGSYTSALQDKKGKIEAGDGGIVFFNEIGEVPLNQQAKFLALLQEKTYTPLGFTEKRRLDAVFLAATNCDLDAMKAGGFWRKDLYYRLHKNVITVPPLRQHAEDIPLLVAHFIRKHNQELHKSVSGAAPEVLDYFQELPWEGNIRELHDLLRMAMLNCLGETITLPDIRKTAAKSAFQRKPAVPAPEPEKSTLPKNLNADYSGFSEALERFGDEAKKEYLLHQLALHKFNISATAAAIGISRKYLDQMMKHLGISRKNRI